MVEKIRELCKKKGISISKLERETGLGNGIIGKWEKFGREPKFIHIKAIADYFGVPVSYLTGEEQKEKLPALGGELTPERQEAWNLISQMNDKDFKKFMKMAKTMLEE